MAYVVQLHNGIYSRSAVHYLERIASSVLDRSKPIILVAHQFTGEAIMAFNETIRQLNVSYIFFCLFFFSISKKNPHIIFHR